MKWKYSFRKKIDVNVESVEGFSISFSILFQKKKTKKKFKTAATTTNWRMPFRRLPHRNCWIYSSILGSKMKIQQPNTSNKKIINFCIVLLTCSLLLPFIFVVVVVFVDFVFQHQHRQQQKKMVEKNNVNWKCTQRTGTGAAKIQSEPEKSVNTQKRWRNELLTC